MKNILTIILFFFMLCCIAQSVKVKDDVNVLFIGNSLTYFFEMPQTVQKMLNETNPNIIIYQCTFPGQSLSGHLTQIIVDKTENGILTRFKQEGEITETELKIKERKWDFIILQDGTVSLLIPENRIFKVNKAIADIKKLVSNPECKFILFQTWTSKNKYPVEYCYRSDTVDQSIIKDKCCSIIIKDYQQEYNLINETYKLVATENNLKLSTNGLKYHDVREKYTEIELYDDESHPNENGAFLNACIFYQMLTERKASKLKFVGEIEPHLAEKLKKIAE